jgi:hypothetical protein
MTITAVLPLSAYRWLLAVYEADQVLLDSLHIVDEAAAQRLVASSGSHLSSALTEVLGEERAAAVFELLASGSEFTESLYEVGLRVDWS